MDTWLLRAVSRLHHLEVILAIVLIGGMIGIINMSGGIKGLTDFLLRRVQSRRTGMLATWISGVLLFFDDFANSLILGNTMRPITDRLRISREKLSYLVDITAGPITAIGLVSTWAVVELGGYMGQTVGGRTELFDIFFGMMPYTFSLVFELAFAFLIAITIRDFGPMRRAEVRALNTGQVLRLGGRSIVDKEIAEVPHVRDLSNRWHNSIVPLAVLIVVCAIALYLTGLHNPKRPKDLTSVFHILGYARFHPSIIWGAVGGTLVAVLLVTIRKHLTLRQSLEAWIRGARSMFLAVVILALSWTMNEIFRNLSIGPWAFEQLSQILSPAWIPALVFLVAILTAFATGSSFTAMALLFPIVMPLAWASPEEGIRFGSLGAVLGGAMIGAHVCPLSETMIFASLSSAVDHLDHFNTQTPYSLIAGGIALVFGFIPVGHGVSPWICMAAGLGTVAGVVFLFGKKLPEDEPAPLATG